MRERGWRVSRNAQSSDERRISAGRNVNGQFVYIVFNIINIIAFRAVVWTRSYIWADYLWTEICYNVTNRMCNVFNWTHQVTSNFYVTCKSSYRTRTFSSCREEFLYFSTFLEVKLKISTVVILLEAMFFIS